MRATAQAALPIGDGLVDVALANGRLKEVKRLLKSYARYCGDFGKP